MPETIPLFPLNTVLFPGGPLALRIFETRYLDMLSRCLKHNQGFGVCLIAQGTETGAARTYTVGTLAQIHDWSNGPDGLLHISASGGRRFRIIRMRTQHDGLNLGEVEWLPQEPILTLPENAQPLAELLHTLLVQFQERYALSALAYDDSSWVGYRLAELMPLPLVQRQNLLEMNDAHMRLDVITTLMQQQSKN